MFPTRTSSSSSHITVISTTAFTLIFLELTAFTVISSSLACAVIYVLSASSERLIFSLKLRLPVILTGFFLSACDPVYNIAKSNIPITSALSATALADSIWTIPLSFTILSISGLLSGTLKSSSNVICITLLHLILFSWIFSFLTIN